jgi:hypothetical protein
MTPDDCRAKADQYFKRVHDAQTSYERRVYLKLARAWLEAALVDDDAPAVMPPAPASSAFLCGSVATPA